jgi:hypothetical protein
VIIPVLVVTIASVVYLRFGQSLQYDELYGQALNERAQATSDTDPIRQRDAWQRVLSYLDKADTYRQTDESNALRADANANLDKLMGIVRLEFIPAFANGLSSSTEISRLAASESELYMLDADWTLNAAVFSMLHSQVKVLLSIAPSTASLGLTLATRSAHSWTFLRFRKLTRWAQLYLV